MEDDIEWAEKHLHNHRSGGESGMQIEHLKSCLVAARKAGVDVTTAGAEMIGDKETTVFKTSTEPT